MIAMETAFLAEIRKASPYSINVLCFPVDPRLGTQYDKGAKKAIEILQPHFIFRNMTVAFRIFLQVFLMIFLRFKKVF